VLGLHSVPDQSGERTELGDALYNYKYDDSVSHEKKIEVYGKRLTTALRYYISRKNIECDAIAFVPPSTNRDFQPVPKLACLLGAALNRPVANILDHAKEPIPVKEMPREYRREHLDGQFKVIDTSLEGKRVLLLDDVIDSGATANAVTTALKSEGKVDSVVFLALTATTDAYDKAGNEHVF
jgi:predicted amidophosphoribosyltransferase